MVVQVLAGFVSAVAFAFIYNVPRSEIFRTGILGGLGWLTFSLTKDAGGEVGAMFLGATSVALCSELFARRYKQPVIIFLVPGVIPLVPGGRAYLTMLSFLQHDYNEGVTLLVSTFFLAGAVAAGIIIASSIFRVYSRAKYVRRQL
ncbi:MAG: threonine/serine exporter family protein [Bacillota bacterium]|nr:threonine/serine exporter family protein [Bacillota bacterium]HHU60804.1 threonine/serine exporter [Natronincola sp.]